MQKKLYWLIHECSCEPVVVFLLCKQWFISFFCISGINMFYFYVFQSKSYKFANLYDELVYQCACMEVFLNVCLVFVCKVSRSSSVCVSRLPLLQKAHFLPTMPPFFYCSSASLQSFHFLLISMMFPFISSTFSFTPYITHVQAPAVSKREPAHVWLFSFNSITPHICKLLRKGDSCFIVFHLSLLLHIYRKGD